MPQTPAEDEAANTVSENTGEWYRIEFFKERAEIAVEMAKRKFARTLNGNTLIPLEAFNDEKVAHDDTLGTTGSMGFTKRTSKLHDGYNVELLKNGVPFDDIAKEGNVPHIIPKDEVDKWAIRITAPDNLRREHIASAFGQSFGKALTKANFVRKQEGEEAGVPLGEITISVATLVNAPDLTLAYTDEGHALMVDKAQLKPRASR